MVILIAVSVSSIATLPPRGAPRYLTAPTLDILSSPDPVSAAGHLRDTIASLEQRLTPIKSSPLVEAFPPRPAAAYINRSSRSVATPVQAKGLAPFGPIPRRTIQLNYRLSLRRRQLCGCFRHEAEAAQAEDFVPRIW